MYGLQRLADRIDRHFGWGPQPLNAKGQIARASTQIMWLIYNKHSDESRSENPPDQAVYDCHARTFSQPAGDLFSYEWIVAAFGSHPCVSLGVDPGSISDGSFIVFVVGSRPSSTPPLQDRGGAEGDAGIRDVSASEGVVFP